VGQVTIVQDADDGIRDGQVQVQVTGRPVYVESIPRSTYRPARRR
jgi:hypothetical protein